MKKLKNMLAAGLFFISGCCTDSNYEVRLRVLERRIGYNWEITAELRTENNKQNTRFENHEQALSELSTKYSNISSIFQKKVSCLYDVFERLEVQLHNLESSVEEEDGFLIFEAEETISAKKE